MREIILLGGSLTHIRVLLLLLLLSGGHGGWAHGTRPTGVLSLPAERHIAGVLINRKTHYSCDADRGVCATGATGCGVLTDRVGVRIGPSSPSSYLLPSSLELSDTHVYEPQIRALFRPVCCGPRQRCAWLASSGAPTRAGYANPLSSSSSCLLSSLELSDTKVDAP